MRFCSRPYNAMHFDPNGYVRLCAWMDISIGNILKDDIRDIWCGDIAKKLRESFEDGSFKYCRATSCPFLENDSLETLTEDEFLNIADSSFGDDYTKYETTFLWDLLEGDDMSNKLLDCYKAFAGR